MPPCEIINDDATSSEITFCAYFSHHYVAKISHIAPSTHRYYTYVISQIFLPEFFEIPLKDITHEMVLGTIDALKQNGCPEIKEQAAIRYKIAFRYLIRQAIDDGILETYPFDCSFKVFKGCCNKVE